MDALGCDIKNITLKNIQKGIESVAKITENISDVHSLTLIISSSGEATFTSSGCKLLSEVNFSHPLTKIIAKAAMNYTMLYGDDCKQFVFVLQEVFNALCNQISKHSDMYMRKNLINEICFIKKFLPCIFKNIYNISNVCVTDSRLDVFSKNLYSIVLTFMLSKFSVNVSKMLAVLLCSFIENIKKESNSLKNILEYVISHFDMFVCKVLSPVIESKVVKGILFYRSHMPFLDLQNVKCIVIWDLTMKIETSDVSWKIADECFASKLDPMFVYRRIFDYFKSLDISLLFTSGIGDNYVKAQCDKCNILLIDQLDKGEIEYLTLCLQVYPLENLNESVESKNIGVLNFAKSLSSNNSHFLHLSSVNPYNFLNAHHILLSAPCNTVWKEYHSECLNCFKLISGWLKSNDNMQICEGFSTEVLDISDKLNKVSIDTKHCNLCSEFEILYYQHKISFLGIKSCKNGGFLLPPGGWEYLFKNCIKLFPDKLNLSFCNILPALRLAIEKSLCQKMGMSLSDVKDFDVECAKFFIKNKLDGIEFLEPVFVKEIMINNVLDLILQLLKIDCIVFQ